jgi:tetratricopeptide (TPR) repeat protein
MNRPLAQDRVDYSALTGPEQSSRPAGRDTAILCGILAVTAAVYLRCLGNGFVLDDVPMLVKNPNLGESSFLWKAFTREEFWYSDATFLPHFRNYRPLLLVWYWIDNRLFGVNPAPWHASVVAVHLVAVWLVFKVCKRLADDSTTALLAASIFALTPVHVAAVVWMAGAGFVLAAAFGLAAFYLVISGTGFSGRKWAAAIALYACALLSHESAIAFPALVAAYAFILAQPESSSLWMRTGRAVLWSWPFAGELLLYLGLRRLVLGFFVSNPYDPANLLTSAQVVLTVPLVFITYLGDLVMPWRTMPGADTLPVSAASSPQFWVPLAAIVLIVAAFLALAMRSPRRRLYLFCGAWMAITLAPMLLLRSVYHLVQDYYLYLPSVGWSILLGDLVVEIARKSALARRLAFGGLAAMLVVYALFLWKVQHFWHDDTAAARGYVEGSPESTAWRLTLATDLERQGDLKQAEQQLRTALRLEPDATGTLYPNSRVLHAILGEVLLEEGSIDAAESELRLSASSPVNEGEPAIARSLRDYIDETLALYHRGVRDQSAGRTQQARAELTQAIASINRVPAKGFGTPALYYVPLLQLYDSSGDTQDFQSLTKEVESLPEGELAVGLEQVEIRLQRSDRAGAEQLLRELSNRYSDNDQLLMRLGNLQADLNQNAQALESYSHISHWFGHPNLYAVRAKSLHALGRDREALEQCRMALASAPLSDHETQFICMEIKSEIGSK